MKFPKGILSHFVLSCLLVLSLVLFAKQAFAQEDTGVEVVENSEAPLSSNESDLSNNSVKDEPNDGTVEVIYAPEVQAPYVERRSNWSFFGGVALDRIHPDKYRSSFDNRSYDQIFGSDPISMVQLEIGPKLNTSLGALNLNVIAGYGSTSGTLTGQKRELTLSKLAASATYILDVLFDEPYVAPYISGQILKFEWEEKFPSSGASISGNTEPAFAMTAGLLIQLNWLEPMSSLRSQTEVGLQNTYLDIFVSQYNTSQSSTDPNFETAMNFGGGLKLEF